MSKIYAIYKHLVITIDASLKQTSINCFPFFHSVVVGRSQRKKNANLKTFLCVSIIDLVDANYAPIRMLL